MSMQTLIVLLLAVIILLILFRRFSRSRYGSLRPSPEVTEAYLSFRVDPGMKYYLSGSDVYPNAVIGIGKSWTLDTDLWKSLNLEQDNLKDLVFNMNSPGLGSGVTPSGYVICDDRGAIIGDWFSLPGQNITIWIKGENRLELSTPANLYPQ